MLTSSAIKRQAQSLGFDLCGVAPARNFPELARLHEWLARGYAGGMRYLHTSADTRTDIRQFLPSARSVIVTGTIYYTGDGTSGIARYAWGEDYHRVLEERLDTLIGWMREQSTESFEARIFVDKHHVQERVFAAYAGLGWIGKNTCLISPDRGSWMFLAGAAVSVDLDTDEPVADGCGACTICIDACPTGALLDDREMDATRCISYLTIEHKGAIPEAQRPQIGNHVYGCDICQEVCPYNLAPLTTLDPAWQPRRGRADATPRHLWQQSDFALHQLMDGSAMTRVSVSRLRRNLAVVLGNTQDEGVTSVLDAAGDGIRRAAPSAETPLVKEHIEWARHASASTTEAHPPQRSPKA